MIGWIILIIIVAVIVYFITKYVTEQKKWGTKKAELEKEFETIKSSLEKGLLEKDKIFTEKQKQLQLNQEERIKNIELKNKEAIAELEKKFIELIKGHRKDAVTRSRSSLMGKLWEVVAPYIPKFSYHPADMKFIGSPIDYIIFEGMNDKDIKKVIFLEVKSGTSKLNAQEKKLKEAIEKKRVKWEEFRIEDITSPEVKENKAFDKEIEKELKLVKGEVGEEEEEGLHECPECKEEFKLLRKERKELEEKGKINVNCPYCGESLTVGG